MLSTLVTIYTYDFANRLISTTVGGVNMQFGYKDATGLVYPRARYMQPKLGVFLSRDVWKGDDRRPITLNGLVYASDNPMNRIDPAGLFDLDSIARAYHISFTIILKVRMCVQVKLTSSQDVYANTVRQGSTGSHESR